MEKDFNNLLHQRRYTDGEYYSLGKCKLKSQWNTTAQLLEWLKCKTDHTNSCWVSGATEIEWKNDTTNLENRLPIL